MTAILQWFAADGTTPLAQEDLGLVPPGTSLATPHVLIARNTGDSAATLVSVLIGQVGGLDLENWLSLEVQELDGAGAAVGSPLTASYSAPANVGSLPAGHALRVTVSVSVPGGAALSSEPLLCLPKVRWA